MALSWDMRGLLDRKYAILQQQADANTIQARTGQYNAGTNRTVGEAAARLDATRANLMPAESAATVAKQGAETRYTDIMAKLYPDVVKSEISERASRAGLNKAQTGLVTQQTIGEANLNKPRTVDQSALDALMGGRYPKLDPFAGF